LEFLPVALAFQAEKVPDGSVWYRAGLSVTGAARDGDGGCEALDDVERRGRETRAAAAMDNSGDGRRQRRRRRQRRKTGLAGRPDIYIGRKTLHLHVN
jgi:hypothetical protein